MTDPVYSDIFVYRLWHQPTQQLHLLNMNSSSRENGKREVRILLVGDPGVGKTSLIFSLVSEEFADDVPARAEEITIPPDVTPDRVTTQIVDFSDREQSLGELIAELNKSSVICIVYSVEDDDSIDRITSYWLPLIRDNLGEEHHKPVVLVGNKSDLVEYSSLDVILPIMNTYPEIETCVECSAKSLKNIAELFFYAQKAVLHPTSPLYSADERDLTSNCKRALSRIFKICDDNNDGILSDDELNAFQSKCFGSPLQPQALEDVKSIVKRTIRDGIFDDGLTLTGFLFLHTLFIQRGRHETTWTVLRKFGYNDRVELDEEFLKPPLDIPRGCSVELTTTGYRFLASLFEKFDADEDASLSNNELESLFAVCPKIPAYFEPKFTIKSVHTDDNGWLSLKGFLSSWTLMTHVEPRLSLEYLAYLGYNVMTAEDSQLSAIQVTRDKRVDLEKRKTTRNVFSCHVIGPQGAGKSSFMKGLLGLNLETQTALKEYERKTERKQSNGKKSPPNHLDLKHVCPSSSVDKNNLIKSYFAVPNYSVSTVPIYGQDKYLIIREVDIFTLTDKLAEPELMCDVVCLTYDLTNPHSFEYIARIYLKHFYECRLPILILGMKADQSFVLQDYIMQPEEFCSKYKLAKPQVFSVHGCVSQDVYVKLATMAAYPSLRRLVHVLALKPSSTWVTQHFNALHRIMPESATMVRASIGLASLALASLFLYRILRSASNR